MNKTDNDALVACFREAHENAIELRRILDGARGIDGFIEMPRALIEKVCTEHSFMAGWCLSSLTIPKAKEKPDE